MTDKLPLSFAVSPYDHVSDLIEGGVSAEGLDIRPIVLGVEEIFYRALKYQEFDACELSMGKYIWLTSKNDPTFSGIPVFPSRVFRHSSIYVLRDGTLKTIEDLRGKRVGIPEWAQTAAIYTRGMLVHQYGFTLQEIFWVQAGVNQPGRDEKAELLLPDGVRIERVRDKSLNQMLLAGEVDAVMSAHSPEAFEHGDPRVVRLIADYQPVEQAYFEQTGVFPIMHIIAIKRSVLERDPWVARSLYKALEEAKERSLKRSIEATASRFPIPWSFYHAEKARAIFGDDPFPYGIEPNRTTLEAFALFSYEQGVAHRHIDIEELFFPSMRSSVRV